MLVVLQAVVVTEWVVFGVVEDKGVITVMIGDRKGISTRRDDDTSV